MLPFIAVLLASPLSAETSSVVSEPVAATATESAADLATEAAPETAAPGFDLSENTLPKLAADDIKPEDYGKWHGTVSIGATKSNGNTDRTTASVGAHAENRREKDRFTFDFLWNYAEEEGTVTQRRTFGEGKYDYFFSKKFYGLAAVSGESDSNADLDLRTTAGLGAGYQFLEDAVWNVNGEAGVSYVSEKFKGPTEDDDYIAARLAYKADYKPSDKWTVGQGAEVFPSLENSEDISARVDTHAKVTLFEKMFAQAQWIFTWDNTPAIDADRADNLFLLMLGWSF